MIKSKALFISAALSATALWLLTKWDYPFILATVFVVLGFSTGVTTSISTHSFLHCFPQSNFCLTHVSLAVNFVMETSSVILSLPSYWSLLGHLSV